MTSGILAFGAYIPRLRLSRRAIAEANAWFAPSLAAQAKGERAICNWDEDAITMAVEASRDALIGRDRTGIAGVSFASTTFPFLDRLNAGVVTAALGLSEDVAAMDVAATQRAATTALTAALSSTNETLVVAAEKRIAKTASPVEMTSGDGAAAILVGPGEPVARLLGSTTVSADFVDHFRTPESGFDYQWEERWIRDAGYMQIVPAAIAKCLAKAGVSASGVTRFCMPGTLPRLANGIAKAAGIPDAAIVDNLQATCGEAGAAHPLLLLVSALETASPGDRILAVGFGQGADVLLFEVTEAIRRLPARNGVKGHLSRRREERNYNRFLAFNDLVEIERGMRSESDKLTPLSAMWRNRDTLTAFVGGRCTKCGTLQFPKSRICVNPNCNTVDSQEPHPFAEEIGRVQSYTADRLTYSPDPPACYGMIQFEQGGRWMMDFTDVEANDLAVGQRMRMMFRVKDYDTQRGFRRYFWKAAPVFAAQGGE